MTISDDVLTRATCMVRKTVDEPDETMLDDCCAVAVTALTARLADGVTAENVRDCFVRSAACMAVADYLETDIRRFGSYTAAGVSRTGRSPQQTRASAQSLRRQAELMMLGFLKDRSFCFKAVRG